MEIPKKWCIKLKDHYDVINNWGKEYFTPITGWGNLARHNTYLRCNFKTNDCTSTEDVTGYYEITFEEFEKYILNKQIDVPEDYTYLVKFLKKLGIK